jgi:hypothetical protein
MDGKITGMDTAAFAPMEEFVALMKTGKIVLCFFPFNSGCGSNAVSLLTLLVHSYATCSCPSGYEGHHCEYRMSLNDVNPYKTKEANQTKRIVFGVFGGVFGGLAVLYAIFLLLKYHPGDQREKNPIENEATPQDPNEPQTSGVYSVELL